MAEVYSFSHAGQRFLSRDIESTRCIADTSFLIALTYELDPFHDDAVRLFDLLADQGTVLYSTVTTRAEYLERQRRILLTEALMTIRKESQFELGKEIRTELTNLKKWIDSQIVRDRSPVPSDRELKRIKEILSNPCHAKKNTWVEMCRSQLHGKLTNAWKILVENIGIVHIELGEQETQELISEKVTWQKACAISEETGIGLYDAMILNMLKCSNIPSVISTDLDFGFAMAVSPWNKMALLPDRLVKKLHEISTGKYQRI